MAPKVMTNDIFKNRKEIYDDINETLVVDGVETWRRERQLLQEKGTHQVNEILAVLCFTAKNAG